MKTSICCVPPRLTPLAAGCLMAATHAAHANLIFTIENAGVQQTSVAGATTETFDALAVGPLGAYASAIGNYDGGQVVAADQYGGANSTRYYAVGVQSGTTVQTLTFSDVKTYFGMWWSAGDAGNLLEFYDDSAALLASYHIGDIIPLLSPAYFGNPNTGQNAGEAYVYLNFTTTGTDRIKQVVFRNNTGSGYEMDNHSVFDQPITPPGNAFPDAGSTLAMFGTALALMVGLRRAKS